MFLLMTYDRINSGFTVIRDETKLGGMVVQFEEKVAIQNYFVKLEK